MGRKIDMTGWKMWEHGVPDSLWTVIDFDAETTKIKHNTYWNCICKCGTKKSVLGDTLRKGTSKSCGCQGGFKNKNANINNPRRKRNLTGWVMKEHGFPESKLTVIKEVTEEYKKENNLTSTNTYAYWLCKCECGNEKIVKSQNLLNGHTQSCGCMRLDPTHNTTINLIGKRFGRLVVKEKTNERAANGSIKWKCLCDCGKELVVSNSSLTKGNCNSCGCLRSELMSQKLTQDLTNQKFGKLTVKEKSSNKHPHGALWICQCDCGNTCEVLSTYLLNGTTKSCGCLKSKGEYCIRKLLQENGIPFMSQKIFKTCRFPDTNYYGYYDFYINNSFLLEFDGEQHYSYNEKNSGWSTKEKFLKTKAHDEYKNNWAKENNIPLKRIPYWKLNTLTIEDIMGDEFLI